MKSAIYLSEKIRNKARRFGESTEYYPMAVIDHKGTRVAGLATKSELKRIVARGKKNPEDIPREKSLFARIFGG